jgi:hypothetical protein
MEKGINLYVKTHEKDLPPGVKVELLKRDDGSAPEFAPATPSGGNLGDNILRGHSTRAPNAAGTMLNFRSPQQLRTEERFDLKPEAQRT